jgi:hypothetical protein
MDFAGLSIGHEKSGRTKETVSKLAIRPRRASKMKQELC